ncbi:hypothetical protein LMG9964_06294 [Paraburkholderia phenoliruptrix]|uniref:Uncharacterized protein n=1 Tax=Paraburkholderia phenoliruptrix TaxID=252970 RepID=A0A6J5KIP7_9BURK|nr:hypothetical protein LMG9964_06294 [Paraburkholderia phenoliruptrix]
MLGAVLRKRIFVKSIRRQPVRLRFVIGACRACNDLPAAIEARFRTIILRVTESSEKDASASEATLTVRAPDRCTTSSSGYLSASNPNENNSSHRDARSCATHARLYASRHDLVDDAPDQGERHAVLGREDHCSSILWRLIDHLTTEADPLRWRKCRSAHLRPGERGERVPVPHPQPIQLRGHSCSNPLR